MTGLVIHWAVETFLYTGLLIAAVLLLRRPVANLFGPRAAYALWLLPLARFVMPPVVLPAWMRPAEPVTAAPATIDIAVPLAPVAVEPAETAPLIPAELLIDAAIAVWLVGAVLFLAWRIACYRAMTRQLMDGAHPVGYAGPIRLVESPAVAAPVAFGVRRRVIALPVGFMAGEDRIARDLAIAHEIAHHRGYDLLANLAAQPLLALHWFNPLAWLGWRAMRRDQEAACDARVIAGRSREDRARYGAVIAACSRDQNLALAAPMAGFREIGPVLGEKAIVHRLRSLGMKTTTRRHRTGLLLIGAAAMLALPATASVSYAGDEPATPPSTVARTDVPASSAAESAAPKIAKAIVIAKKEGDGEIEWQRREDLSEAENAEIERAMAEANRAMEQAEVEIERAHRDAEAAQADAARAHADAERHVMVMKMHAPKVEEEVSADGKRHVIRIVRDDQASGKRMVRKMVIDAGCDVGEHPEADGKDTRHICTGVPHDMIIKAMEQARDSVKNTSDLDAETKAELISDFEAEIAELKAERDRG